MSNREKTIFKKENLFYGFAVGLFIPVIVAWITEIDHPYTLKWWIFLSLWVVAFLAGLGLAVYDRIAGRRMLKNLWQERLGVIKVYPNRDICEQLIKEEYKKAHYCKILILRGISDFGGKDKSVFESLSVEDSISISNKMHGSGSVKVLIAHPNSKFISSQRYSQIEIDEKIPPKTTEKTVRDIRTVEQHLKDIQDLKKINLDYRFYTDGLLCKFYLFDKVGFAVFNERSHKIDQIAPVIEVQKILVEEDREGSQIQVSVGIYAALERYFDFLWTYQSIGSS
jgi:hypothetical protein